MKGIVILVVAAALFTVAADQAVWHYLANCDVDAPGNGLVGLEAILWGPASLLVGALALTVAKLVAPLRSIALVLALASEAAVAFAWPVTTAVGLYSYPSEGAQRAWYCWRAEA